MAAMSTSSSGIRATYISRIDKINAVIHRMINRANGIGIVVRAVELAHASRSACPFKPDTAGFQPGLSRRDRKSTSTRSFGNMCRLDGHNIQKVPCTTLNVSSAVTRRLSRSASCATKSGT